MVNCPFCNEKFYGEDVIFEFKWDDLSRPYIRSERDLITLNMPEELRSRAVYVTFELDSNDTARVKTMDTQPNPASAGAADRLKTDSETGWLRVRNHLKNSGEFIIAYSHKPGFESVPVQAEFYPYGEEGKSGKADRKSGVNRRMFCPRCYQQLKSGCMTADRQVKAIMVGRRAAGKTVFATQMISEFKEGTGGIVLNIEGANGDVDRRYELNKSKLRGTVSSTGQGFVLSTNTLEKQKPYIYVLKHPKRQNRSVCLTLQDIAGEHSENHLMYSDEVESADLYLLFVDPWHIEEIRDYHIRRGDDTCAIVDMTTHGTYEEIANVFDEMLEVLNDKYDDNRLITDKYIAVILVKGDYLNPPMLEEGSEPECEMMRAEANFAGTRDFELEIGLRSSFVRQYMNEWHSTREIVHKVESRFAPQNIRYFVSSALGQSTRPRMTVNEADIFNMGTGAAGDDPAADFNAGDQLLLRQASPKHVIDPVCWYLLKNKLI